MESPRQDDDEEVASAGTRLSFDLSKHLRAPKLSFREARQHKGGAIWMSNKAVNQCFECNVTFTVFNRKHHCRACGRIFCARCSSQRALVHGVEGLQRVCDHCYKETVHEEGRSSNGGAAGDISRSPSHAATPTNMEVGGQGSMGAVGAAGAAVGSGHEEAAAAPPAIIQLDLASKYTYFKGPGDWVGASQGAPKAPPAGQGHGAPASPRRASGRFDGSDGNSSSWHWVLGGRDVSGAASGSSQQQDQAAGGGDGGAGRHKDTAGLMRDGIGGNMEEGAAAHEQVWGSHDIASASQDGRHAEGRDPPIADELEPVHPRMGDFGSADETFRGVDAQFERAPHEALHRRLCVESLHHLEALLSFLLASEGLERSWKPVLMPLITEAATLLGHDALRAAQGPVGSSAVPGVGLPPAGRVEGSNPADCSEGVFIAEDQSWLQMERPSRPGSSFSAGPAHEGRRAGGKGLGVDGTGAAVEDVEGEGGGRGEGGVAPVMELGQYFKVKSIDGGRAGDSFCVRGLVFSNQVVHKKMARRLPPAGEGTGLTLLLLAGSVEYLRGNKYSGLSALVAQDQEAGKSRGAVEEEEYLRVAVERILKQRPDLLLLEGFMAKAGLDLLRNAGVTVVINIKRKVLERLSAATGTPIAQGIQQLRPPPSSAYAYPRRTDGGMDAGGVGVGGGGKGSKAGAYSMYSAYLPDATFSVLAHSTRSKPLICLDPGVPTEPYVTILLRGTSNPSGPGACAPGGSSGEERGGQVSSKVKNVVLYGVYAAATMSTEAALLSDLGATIVPPSPALYPEPPCVGGAVDASAKDHVATHKMGTEGAPSKDQERRVEGGQDGGEMVCFQGDMDEVETWRLLGMSPWIAHDLPPEVSRNLSHLYGRQRGQQQREHPVAAKKEQREKRVWALSPAGLSDWRKIKGRRLSRLREELAVASSLRRPPCPQVGLPSPAHSAVRSHGVQAATQRAVEPQAGSQGLQHGGASAAGSDENERLKHVGGRCVWALPGCSVDDLGADGLRILVSSTSVKRTCVPWSEMCLGFQDAVRHLCLEDFLRRYCFEPTWTCPSPSCSASQLEHSWCFLHESGKVRVRVSRSAPDAAAAASGDTGIMVRTRCVSCARTTNPGSPLSKLGASMSFGRFLLMILVERQLMSSDPSCCHALHSQLLIFTIQQGAQALTALFVHEPVTLTNVEIPTSRLNAVPRSTHRRLISNEVLQTLAATEVLLSTASALAKQWPDHPWLSSGHLTEVFEVRGKLQDLSAGSWSSASCNAEYEVEERLLRGDEDGGSEHVAGMQMAGADGDGDGGADGDGQDDLDGEGMAQALEDDWRVALKLKTQVLLLAQALHDRAPGVSEGGVSAAGAVTIFQASLSSSQSFSVPSTSVNERADEGRKSSTPAEPGSTAAEGTLWCGPEDEDSAERELATSMESGRDGETGKELAGSAMAGTVPVNALGAPSQELAAQEASSALDREGSAAMFAGVVFSFSGDGSEDQAVTPPGTGGGEWRQDARERGVSGTPSKEDRGLQREDTDLKKKNATLAGISGMAGGVGGVVGGLLHGAATSKEGLPAPRPSSFDATILSSVPGRCCYVIPGDYLVDGNPLVVHEDEPASLIALALSSKGYKQALAQQHAILPSNPDTPPTPKEDSGGGSGGREGGKTTSAAADATPSKKPGLKGKDTDEEKSERERQEAHVNVTFEAEGACGLTELSCKVYFAYSFHQLRLRYCGALDGSGRGSSACADEDQGEQDFIRSLRRCKKWNPTGGRSGSAWLKTADERFVLKAISKREIAHFLKAAHEYFNFIATTMDSSPPIPSCLAKIFGLFKVTTTKPGSGTGTSQVLLLTENLLFSRKERQQPLTRIFDLKGSSRNRFVKEAKAGDVQLDDNFHAYIQQYPLYLTEEAKRLLTVAIHNDTVFLTKINVMDYSLLVAVDEASNKLIVGIIDYIRQYTMDKQAETYYKKAFDRVAMGVLKGSGDGPTIIAPPEYRDRFREAMMRDFIAAPGVFTLRRSGESDPEYSADQAGVVGPYDKGVQDLSSLLLDDSQALKNHGLLDEEDGPAWMDQ